MERHLEQKKGHHIPWPGPKPYEEENWREFRGRGEELADVLARVRGARITVLLGESGSGKTSLIRAGVVPVLRLERYDPTGKSKKGVWPVFVLSRSSFR